jgi:glycosyltransferase involved in cell wall biosynthesis
VAEPRATIIVPAHNEEAVIRSTLLSLLRDTTVGEFEVIVVCNGCNDGTAELIRRNFDTVEVIELGVASKTEAINAGLRSARGRDVLLLDADIEISGGSARALVNALNTPGIDAAIGHIEIDVEGGSWPVRAFYRVWARHPYLSGGKFAAAIALSRSAVDRIGQLPAVIADDTYLRRLFLPENVAVVDAVSFKVRVPRTLPALIRVRSRVHRGNRQLDRLAARPQHLSRESTSVFCKEILRHPGLWIDVPWFVAVGIAARLLAKVSAPAWHRDLTSRQAIG